MEIPGITATAADTAGSSANFGDRVETASFEEALREPGGSDLEKLPPELQQNVAQRLSPTNLSHLSQTSKTMTASLRPNMTEAEVTASAQKVNTLPKLRQLVGQVPVRPSQNWQPHHTLQELSAGQRMRPQLVLAAQIGKIRPADRDAAEQLVRSQSTLATADEMNASMRNPLGAAQSLIETRGASLPDAAKLFGHDKLGAARREAYTYEMMDSGRKAGQKAVAKHEPVNQVMSRLSLDNNQIREILGRQAVESFGQQEINAGKSVQEAMNGLGVSSDASRRALEAMIPHG